MKETQQLGDLESEKKLYEGGWWLNGRDRLANPPAALHLCPRPLINKAPHKTNERLSPPNRNAFCTAGP
jgi:hypothetical protein